MKKQVTPAIVVWATVLTALIVFTATSNTAMAATKIESSVIKAQVNGLQNRFWIPYESYSVPIKVTNYLDVEMGEISHGTYGVTSHDENALDFQVERFLKRVVNEAGRRS